jgi:hypothetical protein
MMMGYPYPESSWLRAKKDVDYTKLIRRVPLALSALQDESESATVSVGGSGVAGNHRQGFIALHPHQQLSPATAARPFIAPQAPALGTPGQPGKATATLPPGQKAAASAGGLAGRKHPREAVALTAGTASAGNGRNGSDSGSNTPDDQSPAPDSPRQAKPAGEENTAGARPAKLARLGATAT